MLSGLRTLWRRTRNVDPCLSQDVFPLLGAFAAVSLCFAGSLPAWAQPSGSVERRFQDQQLRDELNQLDRRQEQLDRDPPIVLPAQPPVQLPAEPDQPLDQQSLQELRLDGVVSLPAAVQQALAAEFVGQPLTPSVLDAIRLAVASAYEKARLLAVVAEPRETAAGVVEVSVLEAKLGSIEIARNTSSIRSGWAIAMVRAAIRPGSVVRLDKLESALIKLNDLAGLRAVGTLKPGAQTGDTNVVLMLDSTKRYNTTLNLNNELSQYTGVIQLEGVSTAASWLGRGDLWSLNYALGGDETGYGARRLLGSIDLPVTPDGMRFLGSVGYSDYRLLDDLAEDDLLGSTRSWNVGLRQPLWRRPDRSIYAQVGYDQYRGQDSALGLEYSNRVNHASRYTLVATQQDKFLGSGLNSVVLIGSAGYLDLSANAFEQAADDALAQTAGPWGKIQLIYTRLQLFKDSPYSLEIFAQFQKAFSNLSSQEKFSLGWPNGVRAYPPGEASGDSGASLQLTLRRQLGDQLTLKAFVDGGYVWRWTEWFLEIPQPGSFGLWGPGIGLDYGQYGKALLSVNVGVPMGGNPNLPSGLDADGLNPSVRVWLSGKVWL